MIYKNYLINIDNNFTPKIPYKKKIIINNAILVLMNPKNRLYPDPKKF